MRRIGLALTLMFALAPAPVYAGCAMPENAGRLAAEVGAAVNAARKAGGHGALTRSSLIDEAAQAHACWMAETGTFSHKGRGGSLPKARIRATGYKTRLTAENIAWGQRSAAEVVDTWMQSPAHRENILRAGVDEFGIGIALMQGRPVWVMNYAAR